MMFYGQKISGKQSRVLEIEVRRGVVLFSVSFCLFVRDGCICPVDCVYSPSAILNSVH